MGNLRKNNKKKNKARNMTVLNSATQLGVLKMNRLVLAIIIGLMATVVYLGALLIPTKEIISSPVQAHKSVQLYDIQMNPVISAEVDALKSQLVGLVSGSIESKLKILEEGLRTGTITETGMDTIRALQEDLLVLKTYSETGAGRLIAQKYLQQPNNLEAKSLAEEVSQLRGLVHFLIVSCGLMLAAIAGVWVRKRYVLTSDVSEQKRIL